MLHKELALWQKRIFGYPILVSFYTNATSSFIVLCSGLAQVKRNIAIGKN
jgi:hypothetical protein